MKRHYVIQIALYAMLATIPLVVGCCVNTSSGGCNTGHYRAKAERTEELTAPLTDITALDVATNVGTIRLDGADVTEARITAKITVKAQTEEEARQFVEQVRLRVEPSGRNLVVRAVKPSGFGRNELAVDFTITAPKHLAAECATDVGDVRITGSAGRIEAKTDVGKVVCAGLRGNATLHTNVGDIRVTYAPDAPAAIRLAATTNVGSVDFEGPAEISARLSASANVGSIDTDRPLMVTGQMKKSVNATLGEAKGDITLRTNVGSIKVR